MDQAAARRAGKEGPGWHRLAARNQAGRLPDARLEGGTVTIITRRGHVWIITRRGHVWTDKYPPIAKALEASKRLA
jgi:hypothetical protein